MLIEGREAYWLTIELRSPNTAPEYTIHLHNSIVSWEVRLSASAGAEPLGDSTSKYTGPSARYSEQEWRREESRTSSGRVRMWSYNMSETPVTTMKISAGSRCIVNITHQPRSWRHEQFCKQWKVQLAQRKTLTSFFVVKSGKMLCLSLWQTSSDLWSWVHRTAFCISGRETSRSSKRV